MSFSDFNVTMHIIGSPIPALKYITLKCIFPKTSVAHSVAMLLKIAEIDYFLEEIIGAIFGVK
jgi:hypothetical protein